MSSPDRVRLAEQLRLALAPGGLVLETCHRVEGYVASTDELGRIAAVSVPDGVVAITGRQAIRHVVAVSVGRDSVVVGEDQILHQVREAMDRARSRGGLEPVLERLMMTAIRAGRIARTWGRGTQRSLATVAVAALEREVGPLQGRRILIIGAGRMGQLAARAAASAGAAVTVANRSRDLAVALAQEVGGTTASLDPGESIADAMGLIVALGGPWSIGAATGKTLIEGTAPVVDVSFPAAVPAHFAAALGARLITADDLARGEVDHVDARRLRRLDALIDDTTEEFVAWLGRHEARTAAAALARKADRAREAELALLWRRLPNLDPVTRDEIDAMTRHLARRLLREPFERLGHDTDGRAERAIRDVFAL